MKYNNTVEYQDAINQLVKRNMDIIKLAKTESRELSEDEEKEFDENETEIKELNDEKDELEKSLEEPQNEEEKEEKSHKNINVNTMEKKNFSLLKDIREAVRTGEQIRLDRAYTVASEGEDLVQTDVYNILEPLRAKLALVQSGAHFMSNVKGDIQLPVMTAGNVSWASETGDASDASGSFTNVTLSPKRLTGYVEVSLQLLEQDTVGAEEAIRNDLINALSQKIEGTLLSYNAGSATVPQGLAYQVAYTTVADYDDLCNFEAALERKNVYGDMHYILSPEAKATLRSTIMGTNNTGMIMQGNEVNGVPATSTSLVPEKYFYYGDFSKLWIASWSDIILDVVRDSASLKKGCVTLVVNMYVDGKVTIPEAIAVGKVS